MALTPPKSHTVPIWDQASILSFLSVWTSVTDSVSLCLRCLICNHLITYIVMRNKLYNAHEPAIAVSGLLLFSLSLSLSITLSPSLSSWLSPIFSPYLHLLITSHHKHNRILSGNPSQYQNLLQVWLGYRSTYVFPQLLIFDLKLHHFDCFYCLTINKPTELGTPWRKSLLS